MSHQGNDVARDAYLAGLEFVKFWIVGTNAAHSSVYFMNTERYRAHPQFASAVGIASGRAPTAGAMRGDIVYDTNATVPDGSKGLYRFAFQPNDAYSFAEIALAYELLSSRMPTPTSRTTRSPRQRRADHRTAIERGGDPRAVRRSLGRRARQAVRDGDRVQDHCDRAALDQAGAHLGLQLIVRCGPSPAPRRGCRSSRCSGRSCRRGSRTCP